MTEDEIYRTSTQYRLWSYTSESLASLRATTNAHAAEQVAKAIQNLDVSKAAAEGESNGSGMNVEGQEPKTVRQIDCLTVEEEQKLVGFYCMRTIELSDFCEFPTNVKVRLFGKDHIFIFNALD